MTRQSSTEGQSCKGSSCNLITCQNRAPHSRRKTTKSRNSINIHGIQHSIKKKKEFDIQEAEHLTYNQEKNQSIETDSNDI